jgi:hypothetical protein
MQVCRRNGKVTTAQEANAKQNRGSKAAQPNRKQSPEAKLTRTQQHCAIHFVCR